MRIFMIVAIGVLSLLACAGVPAPEDSGDSDGTCVAETCNGEDDDCDGAVDNDAGDAPT